MNQEREPDAWMWTMLISNAYKRRCTVSWASLCEEEKDAKLEAEQAFNCSVIKVRGKEALYHDRQASSDE